MYYLKIFIYQILKLNTTNKENKMNILNKYVEFSTILMDAIIDGIVEFYNAIFHPSKVW